jgi:hypothetical protein
MKYFLRHDADAEGDEQGAEHSASDFIEFETVHSQHLRIAPFTPRAGN